MSLLLRLLKLIWLRTVGAADRYMSMDIGFILDANQITRKRTVTNTCFQPIRVIPGQNPNGS